ncbi:hypothetical protein [Archaeoglobus fulgidus]|uniref:hypothetical protein n=1 Tax=Archaeoglobus fulgidus TaxID=2234 RepID=UPI0015D915D0|nr:hypothetical protein [Archaeoglobus fulgidus]
MEFFGQLDQMLGSSRENNLWYQKALYFMRRSGIIAKEKVFPKVSANYSPLEGLEFFRIDTLNANLLFERLIVSVLALPRRKKEINLTVKMQKESKRCNGSYPPLISESNAKTTQ